MDELLLLQSGSHGRFFTQQGPTLLPSLTPTLDPSTRPTRGPTNIPSQVRLPLYSKHSLLWRRGIRRLLKGRGPLLALSRPQANCPPFGRA